MELEGKVCVITGATSGIGQVAAEKLAQMGARIVLVARNKERGEAELARLRACAPNISHSIHYADLSRLAEVKRVAGEIAAAEPRIDILANNAGAMFGSRKMTEDGLERHFATNYMACAVLTHGLRERLWASAPARVVNTTSGGHQGVKLDFDDLQFAKRYNGVDAYRRSKLCEILYTRELARRWAGTGVTVNCFDPGLAATRIGNRAGGLLTYAIRVAKLFGTSPERAARTLVYLAAAPEVAEISGGYFFKCRLTRPSREAEDDDTARRLWEATAKLAGIG
jgi:NAD(P)-dependent dehydrogenase (short-subunit alcohol dehydrogenase family)